ncbi:MAG: hypothetical protein KDK36_11845 [Leptospiraceae bacterium]|nr:hypothetical protein [Leptospiraceae bacterium]
MEKKHTIKTAIIESFKINPTPKDAKEIYNSIIENNLYTFKAKNPVSLVSTEVRAYCVGVNTKTSKEPKVFKMENGKYCLV